LRSRKEIDNHVGDELNEKSKTPHTLNIDDSIESKEDESTVIVITAPSKTTPTPLVKV